MDWCDYLLSPGALSGPLRTLFKFLRRVRGSPREQKLDEAPFVCEACLERYAIIVSGEAAYSARLRLWFPRIPTLNLG